MNKNIKIDEILEKLLNGIDLDEFTSRNLMKAWLSEEISPVQTGALLVGLRSRNNTAIELSSMADELLKKCNLPIERPNMFIVDTCGTGGDGANTFNISTAVAFVASSCGVNIAKHGNRSASGKVGSADVLQNLGLNLNASLEKVISAIRDIGITFLFAPAWHQSLIKLAPLRKDLGVRTIFNQLGPLVNPIRPNAQVLGVASETLLNPMANALNNLGMERAIVVHGYGGLDEASLEGDNKIIFVENGQLRNSLINVSDFNYLNTSNNKLVVEDNMDSKQILKSVLKGTAEKAHLEVVALNVALVLWVSGIENNIELGIDMALSCLKRGEPWKKFLTLKNYLED
ncbi:MAG: anthranilate phosphoribosyltransferase [Prochlorococcus sp. SP3034]|nr:anthranilate phosphoribosyltransferase [Prochlorococcus sp. SP3034]|tara:strand:- start:9764 stop:10795 length:1032 start_codon:yes stop_codon:yes gene_type:complete